MGVSRGGAERGGARERGEGRGRLNTLAEVWWGGCTGLETMQMWNDGPQARRL